MVKRGSKKHGPFVLDRFSRSGKREADRLREKLHQRNLKGTHFMRIVSFEQLETHTDKRMYKTEGKPFTEDSARECMEAMVRVVKREGYALAVQLFDRDGNLIEEHLQLYGAASTTGTCALSTHNTLYNDVMESIKRCGVGHTYSKDIWFKI